MREPANKKGLPKNLVPGIHTAIPLNGKTLQPGLHYKFAKRVTINCSDCKAEEKVLRFDGGKLEKIFPDGSLRFSGHKISGPKNDKVHTFTISKRKLQRLRF